MAQLSLLLNLDSKIQAYWALIPHLHLLPGSLQIAWQMTRISKQHAAGIWLRSWQWVGFDGDRLQLMASCQVGTCTTRLITAPPFPITIGCQHSE